MIPSFAQCRKWGYAVNMKLSKREADVHELRRKGLSASSISCSLKLSIHTVRSYLKTMYRKTRSHSAFDLTPDLEHPPNTKGKGRKDYLAACISQRDRSSGCWAWPFALHRTRYGYICINGVRSPVHRVSYEMANGVLVAYPAMALHKCDNPPCFNPDHIFIGSQKDNILDAVSKGRWGNRIPEK